MWTTLGDTKITIYDIFVQCFRFQPNHCFSHARENEGSSMKAKSKLITLHPVRLVEEQPFLLLKSTCAGPGLKQVAWKLPITEDSESNPQNDGSKSSIPMGVAQ